MQMAVSVLNRSFSSDYPLTGRSEGKPAGWKRVFVQTDSGHVLGIELGRGDNASTVKRRMQLVLNVPTEESLLTFGDRVLINDLSNIRNDSPLLLTRNFLHRSSSSPCLSPTGRDAQQRDHSGPIEILGGCSVNCSRMKQLVKAVEKGIKNDVDPVTIRSGMGGAYYFRDIWGERVAIVKPTDEEPFAPNNPKGYVGKVLGQPGLKRSVRVGETGFREVAAYLLDHDHFANVPPTVLVKITHSIFHLNDSAEHSNLVYDKKPQNVSKIASLQQYIPHDFDASDHGTSCYPISVVHRIGILDIRIFNTDRHAGNLLVKMLDKGCGKFESGAELIPIDHGLCLPEALEDPYFEWIHWPQASVPFSEDELEYIANLDPIKDLHLLRTELPMIREACLRVLVLCTTFLKEAAKFGLCLAEIGEMMTRPFAGREEEPSKLENLCIEARKSVEEMKVIFSADELADDFTVFGIDSDDELAVFEVSHVGSIVRNIRSPLINLDEAVEENDIDESMRGEDCSNGLSHTKWFPAATQLPMSLKQIDFFGKRGADLGARSICMATYMNTNYKGDSERSSATSRSASEQPPHNISFVKLSDMNEEEWSVFLEKFRRLLPGAFHDWKSRAADTRQKQRLDTSCQF